MALWMTFVDKFLPFSKCGAGGDTIIRHMYENRAIAP